MTSALTPLDVAPIPRVSLRANEAAESIGVSERTLATWTKAGDVPHAKIGGVVLYPVDSLRAWLAERAGGVK